MILREIGDAVRADVHVRRRRQRRDVGPRLDRDVGPPRPRPGPDDVARRDQRHRAARAATLLRARRPGRPAAVPRPRPRRRRRRAVPRHAPLVHRRGRLRAAPPGRPVGRAVAGADGRWARTSGIRPHGLQALFGLRLEKGHVIVGMDTELDTTPRRLGMDWAVRMEKPRFIGRAALERTAKLARPPALVGFTMDGPAPIEGVADLVRRRDRRQRDRELDLAAARQGADARLAEADAVRGPRRDRRPRGRRHARPRSTTRRATVPALEPLPRPARRGRPGGARCAGRGASRHDVDGAPLRAGRGASPSAPTSIDARRPARDRRGREPASSASLARPVEVRRAPHRVAAARPSARPSPRARSPACRPSSGCPTTGDALLVVHAAYADELATPGLR